MGYKNLELRVRTLESVTGANPSPIITSFVVNTTLDSLTVTIEILAGDDVGVTGWIIKEDDTLLPSHADSDWQSSVYTTFDLTDFNFHILTLRVRDTAGNISLPFSVEVFPEQTPASVPTVDTFTTTNPAANSQDFTFTLTATPSLTETISHYILTENTNVQPLAGDAGWQADAGPTWANIAASLDDFANADVRIYVKDTAGLVSTGVLSRVTVSVGGDTISNPATVGGFDYLWENTPTESAYTGTAPETYLITDGLDLVIDGSDTTNSYIDGTSLSMDPIFEFIGSGVINSATITLVNFHIEKTRMCIFYFGFMENVIINIRNCWFGETWINGEDLTIVSGNHVKGQTALRFYELTDCTVQVYGNKAKDVDGFYSSDNCIDCTIRMKNNFDGGLKSHWLNAESNGTRLIGFLHLWFGSWGGEVSQNINYRPGDDTDGEDLYSFNAGVGTELNPLLVTRNRVWGDSATGAGTNACLQQGDTDQVNGTPAAYVHFIENTVIDYNTPLSLAGGKYGKVNNNKTYTSKEFPARSAGIMAFIAGRSHGIDPGDFFGAEVTGNTCLHYYDAEDGSAITAQNGSDIWFDVVGNDGLAPNHGTLAQGNVDPDGYANNDWQHLAWADGQGKAELWRPEWNSFKWAGVDGLTPSISYDSPWIGDGGSQDFNAGNVSGNVLYGDQSTEGDSVQVHDWASLVSGGVSPVTLTSVSTSTPTIITVTAVNQVLTFTPDTDGPFTYQYTVTDDTGATATGTVSGTVLSVGATLDYFDQAGENWIAINPVNYDELYNRGLHVWETGGTSGPYAGGVHQTATPYSYDRAVGDIETLSPEMVYRVHFDQSGTYDIFIMGMALGSSNYDSLWVGWEDVADTNAISITTDDGAFYWAASERGQLVVDVGVKAEYDLHCWMKEGGFALGAIEVHIDSAGTPKVADSTTSPHTESARVAY